jgi:F-box-like
MLDVLPAELSLNILSYLPIPSLCSLFTLSRRWYHFLFANQSSIFHRAAILRGYTQPGLQLEDALARYTGSPWEGSIDWKDLCKSTSGLQIPIYTQVSAPESTFPHLFIIKGRRFFQLDKNWEGKGRAVARLLSPPGHDVHRIKVDEKAGICITTHILGGLSVTHLFSSVLLWDLPPVRESCLPSESNSLLQDTD